jgi:ABC-type nitrate/sulfonate/bicarbonate transport system substrate-binding protein
MEKLNPNLNMLLLADYGVEMYSNTIFTTETMIQDHPDTVQAFVNSVLRGTQTALEGPADAARYVVNTYGSSMLNSDLDTQLAAMNRSLPLLYPTGNPPGMMSAKTWNHVHDMLVELGLIDAAIDTSKAYDLRFVETFHQAQAND